MLLNHHHVLPLKDKCCCGLFHYAQRIFHLFFWLFIPCIYFPLLHVSLCLHSPLICDLVFLGVYFLPICMFLELHDWYSCNCPKQLSALLYCRFPPLLPVPADSVRWLLKRFFFLFVFPICHYICMLIGNHRTITYFYL